MKLSASGYRYRIGAVTFAASAVMALVGVPGAAAQPSAHDNLAARVAARVNLTDLHRDLIELQRVADRTGGGYRAPGTPGFDQAANYVIEQLTAAGFNVTTQEFPVRYSETAAQHLTVGGTSYDVNFMLYTPNTRTGGITAPLAVLPAAGNFGCAAANFAGTDVAGKIVLIQRGSCPYGVKQANAQAAGAVAILVYNNVPGWLRGSLGPASTATNTDPTGLIPAGGVSQADGQLLTARSGAQVTLELRTLDAVRTTRNVIAQTRTGRTDNVVVAGAHLDSVVEGPGINTNGTGDAALLEAAVKLGGSPKVRNAVRFTFWGGWEFGLVGSADYLSGLTDDQQLDMALYLNFDTLGSRNGGYFVYDGSHGPYGSAAITQSFEAFLAGTHVPTQRVPFTSVYSDELGFVAAGIPSGGLYSGQEEYKTAAQAALFGGTADQQMDPCFHELCDNLGNVDNAVFLRNATALAYVTTSFAVSTEGVNGVPAKAERAALRSAAARRAANAVTASRADQFTG